jgi:hypothetical protein
MRIAVPAGQIAFARGVNLQNRGGHRARPDRRFVFVPVVHLATSVEAALRHPCRAGHGRRAERDHKFRDVVDRYPVRKDSNRRHLDLVEHDVENGIQLVGLNHRLQLNTVIDRRQPPRQTEELSEVPVPLNAASPIVPS